MFCTHYANTKALAGALGVSAGVMLYVSFVEIFAIKSVESFATEYPDHGSKYATLCFFCGIVLTIGLDALGIRLATTSRETEETTAPCACATPTRRIFSPASASSGATP